MICKAAKWIIFGTYAFFPVWTHIHCAWSRPGCEVNAQIFNDADGRLTIMCKERRGNRPQAAANVAVWQCNLTAAVLAIEKCNIDQWSCISAFSKTYWKIDCGINDYDNKFNRWVCIQIYLYGRKIENGQLSAMSWAQDAWFFSISSLKPLQAHSWMPYGPEKE